MVWYSHLFKEFSTVCYDPQSKAKTFDFSIVNETEIDVFLEVLCFLCYPVNVGNLISGAFAFSKPSLDIWKLSVYVMPKPSLKDFEHNLISLGGECSCLVV